MLTGVSNVAEVCVEQVVFWGDQVSAWSALSDVAVWTHGPGLWCGAERQTLMLMVEGVGGGGRV